MSKKKTTKNDRDKVSFVCRIHHITKYRYDTHMTLLNSTLMLVYIKYTTVYLITLLYRLLLLCGKKKEKLIAQHKITSFAALFSLIHLCT